MRRSPSIQITHSSAPFKKVFAVSLRSASFAPESTITAHLPTYHSPSQLTFLLAVRRLSLYTSLPPTTFYSLHSHHHLLLLLQPTNTIFFCFYSPFHHHHHLLLLTQPINTSHTIKLTSSLTILEAQPAT